MLAKDAISHIFEHEKQGKLKRWKNWLHKLEAWTPIHKFRRTQIFFNKDPKIFLKTPKRFDAQNWKWRNITKGFYKTLANDLKKLFRTQTLGRVENFYKNTILRGKMRA